MKKIIYILLLAVVTSFTFSSCEDMLTGDMDRNVEAEGIAKDTLYGYWGILQSLQGIAERYVILGECRGDLVDGTQFVQDSISSILEFMQTGEATDGANVYHQIKDYYHIINSCNSFLANVNSSKLQQEYAQVLSIRAWVYMQLVLTYGRVPYIDKPVLSVEDINNFRNAEQWLDINNLATCGIVQQLKQYSSVPMPDYGTYGRTKVIAHSTQCMFPQDLVLGDIYLMSGEYMQAAQHYYNFLTSSKGGPLWPEKYYALLQKSGSADEYLINSDSYSKIFSSVEAVKKENELITVIPSSTNKLWGRVLRDVNELFGYTSNIRVSTSATDTTTTASISLSPNFEHQLGASQAYTDLNKDQNFEAYIQDASGNLNCRVLSGAGDARYRVATSNLTDTENGGVDPVNFVTKQNPNGVFSTVYPVIYRKGNVWLRFAAALNGAGLPGYAFAILRHGLNDNEAWIPDSKYDFWPASWKYWDNEENTYNPITEKVDTTFYADDIVGHTDKDFLYHVYQEGLLDATAQTALSKLTTPPTDGAELLNILIQGENDATKKSEEYKFMEAFTKFITSGTRFNKRGKTFTENCLGAKITSSWKSAYPSNWDNGGNNYNIVCNYITKTEWEKASKMTFTNFRVTDNRMRGLVRLTSTGGALAISYLKIYYGTADYNLSYADGDTREKDFAMPLGGLTTGIHARGGGVLISYEEPYSEEDGQSTGTTYNYVYQINKMLKKYEGATTDLTDSQIFDWGKNPATENQIQLAIADLILEEMALETCFEGNRFFDLLCYSKIINSLGKSGTDRVAKMIASRNGTLNGALYSRLSDQNNWYLPCP